MQYIQQVGLSVTHSLSKEKLFNVTQTKSCLCSPTHAHTHTHTHAHTQPLVITIASWLRTTMRENSTLNDSNLHTSRYMCACKWEVNATALFVLVVPTMCVCVVVTCAAEQIKFSLLCQETLTHWFGFSRNCSFRLTDLRATYLLTTFMQFLSCCLLHVNDFDSVTFFVIIQAWITSIGDTVCFFSLSY